MEIKKELDASWGETSWAMEEAVLNQTLVTISHVKKYRQVIKAGSLLAPRPAWGGGRMEGF